MVRVQSTGAVMSYEFSTNSAYDIQALGEEEEKKKTWAETPGLWISLCSLP